jgi:hypothetical protein
VLPAKTVLPAKGKKRAAIVPLRGGARDIIDQSMEYKSMEKGKEVHRKETLHPARPYPATHPR